MIGQYNQTILTFLDAAKRCLSAASGRSLSGPWFYSNFLIQEEDFCGERRPFFMVEPTGSIILNTLLQGRATLALHPASIYSKVMPRPARVQLTPGFFSPQPRRAEGKERMTDSSRADVLSVYSAQCKDWSCRMRISVYCSGECFQFLFVLASSRV
jgi:hypothetical protein